MAKKFNVTGLCFPKRHYMADVSRQLDDTFSMIEEGEYFIINRPRQYGKTTAMHILRERLIQSGYIIFHISFEGIGDLIFTDEKMFSSGFMDLLANRAHESAPELKPWLKESALRTHSLNELGQEITELCSQTAKKVVVFIDEVDKSSNNQLFVSFLALLRDKYLDRDRNPTFHCVMLAGVHDVKNLKLKIRPEDEKKYNSPWNIATKFKVDMNLSPAEIKPMLDDYAQEQGVKMDTKHIAERLFYFTSGYPYLTSQMCKTIAEDILPQKMAHPDISGTEKEWTDEDLQTAFQMLLREEGNTNFDSLIKNLESYPDLYELVSSVVIDGIKMDYRSDDPLINLGSIHGIFAPSESGTLKIHNRIYRERIANYMISKWRTSNIIKRTDPSLFDYTGQYRLPNNGLNLQKVLENFQAFMKQQYSDKDRKFVERDGRLIFLAFIKPIINGGGYDFREPQVSEERRLDVVITYFQHQYVAELKIWYGQAAHEEGLLQLADYLDRLGLDTGYLLIFDHNKKKFWKKDWVNVQGKRIFWVRV